MTITEKACFIRILYTLLVLHEVDDVVRKGDDAELLELPADDEVVLLCSEHSLRKVLPV